jgi:hypothetical protein
MPKQQPLIQRLKVHYRFQKSLLLGPILIQIHINIILTYEPRSSEAYLSVLRLASPMLSGSLRLRMRESSAVEVKVKLSL